jgi:hypothetical protein
MNGLYFLPLPNNVSCFTSNVKLHRKSHWSTTSTLSVGFLVNMWMLGEGRDNRNGPAWSAPYSDVTKFEMPCHRTDLPRNKDYVAESFSTKYWVMFVFVFLNKLCTILVFAILKWD